MLDFEQSPQAESASLRSDLWLFALTWAAGFVFTLVFFA
jgi:hypothetical protein